MYKLFEQQENRAGGVFVPSEVNNVMNGLRLSLKRAIGYRRANPVHLKTNHVLVKLLESLNVGYRDNPSVYVAKVQDACTKIAVSLGWCTELSYGRLNAQSEFYGPGIQDIIIADDEYFDAEQAVHNWMELQPIRVLTHPLTDLWCHVPDGRNHWVETGIAVIVVNIPMLALQWQLWKNKERSQSTEGSRSTNLFLQEVPLPNMLHSHLDVAVANRFMKWLSTEAMPKTRNRHPFFMQDWERSTDRLADQVMDSLLSNKLTFDRILFHIPLPSGNSLQKTVRLPQKYYLQQMQWAILLSRLELIAFVLQLDKISGSSANLNEINYIRRCWLEFNQARLFQNSLNAGNTRKFRELVDNRIKPYL